MRATLETVEDVAAAAAERIADAAEAGRSIVLAGGSTPRAAYELAARADWSAAKIWFGDERCVAKDDPRSNFRMARDSLLENLVEPPAAVFRIEGELGASEAAHRYAAEIFEHEAEPFGLVLLGLGPDGHTASLFPGRPEAHEAEALVTAVPEAGLEPFVPRVSLTVPALASAREILFLVSGETKAEAVRQSFATEGAGTPAASVVAAAHGRVSVLLDAAAASRLGPGSGSGHP